MEQRLTLTEVNEIARRDPAAGQRALQAFRTQQRRQAQSDATAYPTWEKCCRADYNRALAEVDSLKKQLAKSRQLVAQKGERIRALAVDNKHLQRQLSEQVG